MLYFKNHSFKINFILIFENKITVRNIYHIGIVRLTRFHLQLQMKEDQYRQ